jgi:hypothetical protein
MPRAEDPAQQPSRRANANLLDDGGGSQSSASSVDALNTSNEQEPEDFLRGRREQREAAAQPQPPREPEPEPEPEPEAARATRSSGRSWQTAAGTITIEPRRPGGTDIFKNSVLITQEDPREQPAGGAPRRSSPAERCVPQSQYQVKMRTVAVPIPGTDGERHRQNFTDDQMQVIKVLQGVGWLEWQLALYGMFRTTDRHKWLRDECACSCGERQQERERQQDCWPRRVFRWFFGLSLWSIVMCCLATANAVERVRVQVNDTARFTDYWDQKDQLDLYGLLGQNFTDDMHDERIHKQCCNRDGAEDPMSNGAHVAKLNCLISNCFDTFAAHPEWVGLVRQHVGPEDSRWSVITHDAQIEHVSGLVGWDCSEPGEARLPAASHWEEPAVVATAACHATHENADGSSTQIAFPQMCTPGFYCNTIAELNEVNGLNLATAVASVVLALLLLFNHLLVLKIATPGGSGKRTHPLTDAIDPFTLLACAMDVVRENPARTPEGLQEAARRQAMHGGGAQTPTSGRDVELPLLANEPGAQTNQRRSALDRMTEALFTRRRKNLQQTGHDAMTSAARFTALVAWLPIVFLSIWWCYMPLETLGGNSGLQYVLTNNTLDGPDGSYTKALQPPLFVLLSYPSLVTTALLLRVVCAIHMHHADGIVASIAADSGGVDGQRVDRHIAQFKILRKGLQTTGKRWEWLLLVQILIFVALATIPCCQLWGDHIGLSQADGDSGADDWNELTMVLAQFCPLGLCMISIMDINSKLDAIPGDLTRRDPPLLDARERADFEGSYTHLKLGIYVFGVRLTTTRLRRGVFMVIGLLLFSKFKDAVPGFS